jgi:transcriptional regulator with XRE-family HTH domain
VTPRRPTAGSLSQSSSAAGVLTDLRRRLHEIRSSAGLSQTALARLTGWHPSKVSKIEAGRQVPGDDDIRAWCSACTAEDTTADLLAGLHTAKGLIIE